MRLFKKQKLLGGFAAIAVGGLMVMPCAVYAQNTEQSSEGAEVLTRGPVHEAFAETISFDPQEGIIVDREPPEAIEEIPPEQELEGDNVTWIPGYWGWDDERSDFLWISGIWRNLPPEREWVPGYWAEIEGKYQWTSGYWQDAETEEVTYLPEPPKSLEQGPSVEATSNDQTWVPGNWVYREDRYAWRPGTWSPARENWIWVPAYYRWTPRGYVYVDGYWDYPVARRGVVFAPVHFQREYISRPNYSYTPSTVISLAVFTNHLFLRPRYNHYYYGDYYEPTYRDRGYYASYSYSSSRRGYDPFYSHQRWQNREDRNWERSRRDYFEYRRDNEDARPPRSWAAFSSRGESDRQKGDFGVVERYDRVVNDRDDNRQKFRKIDKQERERYVTQSKEIRDYSKERKKLEVRSDKSSNKDEKVGMKVPMKRSPVVSKKTDRSDKDGGPPARLQQRDVIKGKSSDAKDGDEKSKKTERTDSDMKDQKKDREPDDRKDKASEKDQPKTKTETRTEPGKRREAAPEIEGKAKDSDPEKAPKKDSQKEKSVSSSEKTSKDGDPQKKEKSSSEKQPKDSPVEKKAQPEEKKIKADPNPDKKERPAVEKQPSERAPQPREKQVDSKPQKQPQKVEKTKSPQPEVKRSAEKPREVQQQRVVEKKAAPRPEPKQAEPKRSVEKKAPARAPEPKQKSQPRPEPKPVQKAESRPSRAESAPSDSGKTKSASKSDDKERSEKKKKD